MRMLKILYCAFPIAVFAQPLPLAKRTEDVGISSERIERVRQVMKHDVESKRIPGGVLLIVRNDRIAMFDSFGYQDASRLRP
jgi:hypothetical protein